MSVLELEARTTPEGWPMSRIAGSALVALALALSFLGPLAVPAIPSRSP